VAIFFILQQVRKERYQSKELLFSFQEISWAIPAWTEFYAVAS
jgi:hypothetical protein